MQEEQIIYLLKNWEDVYKQGQLTFWILLSLKHGSKKVEDIINFITEFTEGHFKFDEQSIYRLLRRYLKVGLVKYSLESNTKGPNYKVYELSEDGKELLRLFVNRNLKFLYKKELINLLNTNL